MMKTILFTMPLLALMISSLANADTSRSMQTTQEEKTPGLQEIDADSQKHVCALESEIFSDLQVHIGDDVYLDPVCAKTSTS